MPLEPLALPTDDWASWLADRAGGELRLAGTQVGALKEAADDAVALEVWNDAMIALGNAFAVCSLLSSVHPDPSVVEQAERIEVEARAFSTDLFLDAEVFARLDAVDPSVLDEGGRRVLADALRDFRRSGVDRDDDVRERVRALDQRLTDLEQAFSRHIRDGRRTTRVPADALDGLPDDFVADHPVDADGQVTISTEYPDTHPFLAYCSDPEARHAVAATYYDLAHPANDQVLLDLLDTRHEKATLLGYAGFPDYDAETKMIGTGEAIAAFVDRIAAQSLDAGERDVAVLRERAAQDGVEQIDISNSRYYSETVRREQYDVDAQQVRRYLDFGRVHDGLLAVTGRLFGLDYVPVDRGEARTWHEDVSTYDVVADGAHLGRIHLDLHTREGKYNHAAQFDLVPGVAGRQLPEGVLVCNFPRGLMDHDEVVTLFHEFGHLLHHVLAGHHSWVRFSGVATEWDFVEAPSQMLEEWAWSTEVLQTFATDEAGEPIPAALVEAMRAADEFGKGVQARTQMFYAALSYRLHEERPRDLTAAMFALYDTYSLVRPIPESHFYAGFGHLAGYTSAYYTYMWSLVIAKDMFSAFDAGDLFAPEVAHRYRDTVLVPGGSKDAADLVEDFLGRPYDTEAFTAWLDRPAR
ncbi:Zn-dependent oligopeptidase [Marmoricola endophyticus]|uniref:Zn-dependent oligopeptidase n=1 Tax=Marmoricola endophyticus TaxID=2040280 RepID=A0A917BNI8_9ACTN|nr:M3 family metallopeptidase [Marmoricola endophyticus]GGF47778.1 Zn-dependent oligopeptidase [Marmoricola endophyticus]